MRRVWEEGGATGGQELVMDTCHAAPLLNSCVTLMNGVTLNELEPHLLALHVITVEQRDQLHQPKDETESQKMLRLVTSILPRSPVWRLHGFLRSLALINRHDLIAAMGQDPDMYTDSPIRKPSLFHCPVCRAPLSKPTVLPTCGHYVCAACLGGNHSPATSSSTNTQLTLICPVKTCKQPSTLTSQDLATPSDTQLETLYSILGERQFDKYICTVCSNDIPSQKPLHSCKACRGEICANCYLQHKQNEKIRDHETVHNHQRVLCCAHGKLSTHYCEECGVYCCVLCLMVQCEHHHTVKLEDMGETAGDGGTLAAAVAVQEVLERMLEDAKKTQEEVCQSFKKSLEGHDIDAGTVVLDRLAVQYILNSMQRVEARARRWEEVGRHMLTVIYRPGVKESVLLQLKDALEDVCFPVHGAHDTLSDCLHKGLIHWHTQATADTQTDRPNTQEQASQHYSAEMRTISTQTEPEVARVEEESCQTYTAALRTGSTQTEPCLCEQPPVLQTDKVVAMDFGVHRVPGKPSPANVTHVHKVRENGAAAAAASPADSHFSLHGHATDMVSSHRMKDAYKTPQTKMFEIGLGLSTSMRHAASSSYDTKTGAVLQEIDLGKRGGGLQVTWVNAYSVALVGQTLDMLTFNETFSDHTMTTMFQEDGPYRHVSTTPGGSTWMTLTTTKSSSTGVLQLDIHTDHCKTWQPRELPNLWLLACSTNNYILTSSDNSNIYVYDSAQTFQFLKSLRSQSPTSHGFLSISDMKCVDQLVVSCMRNHSSVYVTTVDRASPVYVIDEADGQSFGSSLSVAVVPHTKHIIVADVSNRRVCVFDQNRVFLCTEQLPGEVWECKALYIDAAPRPTGQTLIAVSTWDPKKRKLFICELK